MGSTPNLERFLIAALAGLALLAVVAVLIAPRLERASEIPAPPTQTEILPARVIEVLEEGTVDLGGGGSQPYQRLLVYVESGSLAGQEVTVEEGTVNIITQERLFRPGDRVYLERVAGPQGDRFYISDFVRTGPLLWIIALFLGLVILVGRGKGLRSLGGTFFSLLVIFAYILPQILAGRAPVAVSMIGPAVLPAVSTNRSPRRSCARWSAASCLILAVPITGLIASLMAKYVKT